MSENLVGEEVGNKLSVKSFGWDKPKLQEMCLNNKAKDHFLARFGGVATGLRKYKVPEAQVKDGENEGFGLSGTFIGINEAGEQIKGSVLYLPRYIHEMVEAALSMGDDVAGVRIGFDVYARYDEKSATSYIFAGRDLLNEGNASVDQVVADMMALGMPGQPKLAAPKK